MNARLFNGIALSVIVGCAQICAAAEIGFGIRDSQLQFEWLRGAAGDVRLTGGSDNPSRPLLSDGCGLVGGETDEGDTWPVGPWNASANWVVSHGYKVGGTRDDVESISGSGQTQVFTMGQNCITEITGRTNLLTLEFQVGGNVNEATPMRLRTMLSELGTLADSTVRIDVFTPVGWIAVKVYESGAGTFFDETFDLYPGLHRIQANAYARVVTDTVPARSTFQYALFRAADPVPDFLPPDYVPEPVSGTLLAGLLLLGRRRHR